MEVSIIVPVRNGARTIRNCLDSILGLHFPEEQREIICVDNGSEDSTPAILDGFRDRIRLVHENKPGAAAARNTGLRAAQGKWIAFTDADCAVDPRWIEHLIRPLQEDRADAVGGRIVSRPEAGWIERFGDWVHDHRTAIEGCWPPYIITMNMAVPRALLEQHGGFDERWLRSQDSELSFRMASAGRRFAYVHNAVITHYHRSTLPGLCREGFLHGRYGAELFRIYAELSARGSSPPKPEDQIARSWRLRWIKRVYSSAKRVGWAVGRRYPPPCLRARSQVLLQGPSPR